MHFALGEHAPSPVGDDPGSWRCAEASRAAATAAQKHLQTLIVWRIYVYCMCMYTLVSVCIVCIVCISNLYLYVLYVFAQTSTTKDPPLGRHPAGPTQGTPG